MEYTHNLARLEGKQKTIQFELEGTWRYHIWSEKKQKTCNEIQLLAVKMLLHVV